MTRHQVNTPHPLPDQPAPPGFGCLRSLAALRGRALSIVRGFTAASVLGVAALAGAAEPRQPAAATTPAKASDVVLARSALVALDADAELRGVNFVVSVVDRVALVGGPVANLRQAKRAEEVVRALPGVADVRNTCFVAPGPDPLLRALADRLGSPLPPRPVMLDLPGVLTGTMPSSPFAPPVPDTAFAQNPTKPGTVVALRPAGEPGLLGAPVGAAVAPPFAPPATPGVLTANRGDLLTAADAVRGSEPRFAKLTVELRDGVLVVGGSAPLASDAWDFAQKLKSVPGANRVAVGAVAGK